MRVGKNNRPTHTIATEAQDLIGPCTSAIYGRSQVSLIIRLFFQITRNIVGNRFHEVNNLRTQEKIFA